MPLIISELITTVEQPEGADAASPEVTGLENLDAKTLGLIALSKEREERLQID